MKHLTLLLALLFLPSPLSRAQAPTQEPAKAISCEGIYPQHLQGFCWDDQGHIYWSFTTMLVKSDSHGKVLKKIPVASHHGDLCHHDGKLYVAVNLGPFNDPEGKADSWVYSYRADTLTLLAKHKTPQLIYGAGGMAYHDGKMIVIGGLPEVLRENYLYEYDLSFKFLRQHIVPSGYTRLGIQTAAIINGNWWFGCYGNQLLKTDKRFQLLGKYEFDCGLGIAGDRRQQIWIARGTSTKDKGCTGQILPVTVHPTKGLLFLIK
jgi:hypothetical protein